MTQRVRRIVTGHDERGKSVIVFDGPPPQHHSMRGVAIGADFIEIWNSPLIIPLLTSVEAPEPNEREFTIMPVAGHLLRTRAPPSFTSMPGSATSCSQSCPSPSS